MASVVYDGTAFPLVWIMLGKAGSTSGAEQRGLLRKLLLVLPPEHIGIVVADREFIGQPFMGYLTARGVGYGVRIRKDARVGFRGRTQRAETLFGDLVIGQGRRLRARRAVYGQAVWLYGLRLPDGKGGARRLLIVAGTVRRLLKRYRLRWGIEVLFAGLKSRGFDFETTHLKPAGAALDAGRGAGSGLQLRARDGALPDAAQADCAQASRSPCAKRVPGGARPSAESAVAPAGCGRGARSYRCLLEVLSASFRHRPNRTVVYYGIEYIV